MKPIVRVRSPMLDFGLRLALRRLVLLAATLVMAPDLALALSPSSGALPDAILNQPYSQIFSYAGGVPGKIYQLEILGGVVPPGLSLDAPYGSIDAENTVITGTLSGTPTEAGTFSFSACALNLFTGEELDCSSYTLTVKAAPVAAVSTVVTVVAGTSATVDLTEGATGGPFTGAQLVSLSPAAAGSAVLTTAASGQYGLKFTAAPTFEGTAVATFTISSASGTSAPATITFNVTSRPDPSQDPEVVGLVNAQVQAAARFASTQISNFNDHLERLHDGGCPQDGWNIVVGDSGAGIRDTAMAGRYGEPASTTLAAGRNSAEARQGRCLPAADGSLAFWSGGFVDFGSMAPGAAGSGLDFTTIGVSGGVDYRASSDLTVGIGFGFGRDRSRVGDGARSDGEAYSGAIYGSFHPASGTFVDGIAGYGMMTFDSTRYQSGAGGFATGRRDGDQVFASLTAGYRYVAGGLLLSPYGRISASHSSLDAFTERGTGWTDLHYGQQSVDTVTGFLGLRASYKMATSWGSFTPNLRLEYGHDFAGGSSVGISYADQPARPLYVVNALGTDGDHVNFGIGADLAIGSGWTLGTEYGVAWDRHGTQPRQVRLTISGRF